MEGEVRLVVASRLSCQSILVCALIVWENKNNKSSSFFDVLYTAHVQAITRSLIFNEIHNKGTLSHKAPGSSEGITHQRNIITQGTRIIWREPTPKEHYHTRHRDRLKETHTKGTLSHKAPGSSEGNPHLRNIITQGTGIVWREPTPKEHYHTRHGVVWREHTPKERYYTRHQCRLKETHTEGTLLHKAPGSSKGNTHQRHIIPQGTGVIWRKHTPKENYPTRHRSHLKETYTEGTLSHKAPWSS